MEGENFVLPKQTIIATNSDPITQSSDHIQQADAGSEIAIKAHQTDDRPIENYEVAQDTTAVKLTDLLYKSTKELNLEAEKILHKYFDDREFDFEKFAKINGIPVDPNSKPCSASIQNSFQRMTSVALDLLNKGISINKEEFYSPPIKLTSQDIVNTTNFIELFHVTEEEKAYLIYSELGNVIQRKLLECVTDGYFIMFDKCFSACIKYGSYCCRGILSLPLVNFNSGMEMCINMAEAHLPGLHCDFQITNQSLSKAERMSTEHQKLVNQYKAIGMNFAFGKNDLAEQILPAAQFAASIGMQLPLFITEITGEGSGIGGFTHCISGILVHDSTLIAEPCHGFQWPYHVFFHEITHHARSAVGAMFRDKSIARQNLSNVLENHADTISAIESQISDYALTNYEEYISEFSSLVLCALEEGENPFDYIKDERLWRLYYEFGGPDFAQTIQEKGFLLAGYNKDCNILSDSKCDWCSGYPSKFSIDIKQIKDQQVVVEGLTGVGVKSNVTINEKTILPPPPLGYCYEVQDNKLKLKDLKNGKYYDPTFCSLTDGPLTLMKTTPALVHHFELLPKESSGILKMFKSKP